MDNELDAQKRKEIVDASLKIIKRIYDISPQYSDGTVNYYLCGSLITNVLPLVKKMDDFQIDKASKKMTRGKTVNIPEELKEELLTIVRPSRSNDIDVAIVNKRPYDCSKVPSIKPHSGNIKAGIESEYDLIFQNDRTSGYKFDELESVSDLDTFYLSVATLEDGSKIIMPSLVSILLYKYRDAVNSVTEKDKIGKREDFEKLYKVISKIIDTRFIKKNYDEMFNGKTSIDEAER